MCLFVHMRDTTGDDAGARRAHVYADRCAQCGVALTSSTRVAAHVRVYGCGWCGGKTLRTTCKACNHAHSKRRRWFPGMSLRMRRLCRKQ